MLTPLGMSKRAWPSMNGYEKFIIQTSTSTPGMHQKLTEHGKDFMQNNNLPTKTLVKLKDNSNLLKI